MVWMWLRGEESNPKCGPVTKKRMVLSNALEMFCGEERYVVCLFWQKSLKNDKELQILLDS